MYNYAPKVGSIVHFGAYDWLVLDVQQGKALLLTKDCVEKRQYHSIYTDIIWVNCTLRQYLNSEFMGKFAASDQRRILTTHNVNSNNPWWNTPGEAETDDKTFLLNLDEVVGYFGDSIAKAKLKNRPSNDRWINSEHFQKEIVANLGNSHRLWWLRSRGIAFHAAGISSDGCVSVSGSRVDNGFGGVRPALWINIKY